MIVRGFLVVRADGSTRTVAKTPRLGMNEFAFRLTVRVPDAWGEVLGTIEVDVPHSVIPTVTVDVPTPETPAPTEA